MTRFGLNRNIGSERFMAEFKLVKELSEINKKGKPSEKEIWSEGVPKF
jgi:hypothetical protein